MKKQMKLNYNGFIEHIADVLAAEDIETVQNEAWSIEVGIQLLNGYMEQLAKRAIEKGITEVVFDRGGYIYPGRVASVADGAREAGLKF